MQLDPKELVDLCTKAGIPGKGSALASLVDEEIVKLKAYLEGTAAKRSAAAAAHAVVDTRSVLTAPVAATAVLPPPPPPQKASPLRRPPKPVPVPVPPAPDISDLASVTPPPASVPPAPSPVAPAARAPSTEAPVRPMPPPSPPASSEPDNAPPRRPTPGANRGPIKVLGGAKRPPTDKKKDGDKAPEKRAPAIRFAEMPAVKQPQATQPAGEATQKPVIRLPADVIKGVNSAPLQDITKRLENERKRTGPGEGRKGGKDQTPAAPGAPLSTGVRGRQTKKPLVVEEEGLGDLNRLRAERQKARKPNRGVGDEEEGSRPRRKRTIVRTGGGKSTAAPRKDKVELELPATVRSFSEAAGVSSMQVMKALMQMGQMLNINAHIPDEMVELLAAELGVELAIKQQESLEDELIGRFDEEDSPEALQPRPPIVTFLGHVDHGKTSLLDKIIGINVVKGEAGGITQHIRAYSVTTKDGRKVAFVDTPGHEAFTEMRARGANVTDIAVLVVAADDGVMPQTEEAISHIKAAGVPIVVAMNKIDLPSADEQKVLQQLAAAELLPSEWGGDVEVIRTSAHTGRGMDDLLETLLVTAELNEYKANPDRDATGMCLEAEQEAGRGVIAKVMVQNGTLKEGDIVVCGAGYGRVKAMYDTLDVRKKVKTAGPSTPVNITGFDVPPNAGDKFYVVDDIAEAREIAASRGALSRQQSLGVNTVKVSFEEFQRRLAEGSLANTDVDVATLNLIIRADVRGSIEAILKELSKFDHPEVKVKVLQASVGGVTVADVTLASAASAVIIGFNVIPDETARALADERHVEIRRYDIIYKLTDDIKLLLEGKLKPESRIVEMGRAMVKQVFTISRVGAVAGCHVMQGAIERGCRIRVNRDERTIGDYAIETLKRVKDDVKEVSRGMECGIKLQNFNDIKQGDLLEAYKIEEVARTL
jgi:translation initiation factor IF-2